MRHTHFLSFISRVRSDHTAGLQVRFDKMKVGSSLFATFSL